MNISILHTSSKLPVKNLAGGPGNRSTLFPMHLKMQQLFQNIVRWFKFTLKPPYSITHGKLRLAIWDTSFWTFLIKFGHKGP